MGNRLVLFVEGDGDVDAVSILVKRILTNFDLWGSVFLDPHPFRIGEVGAFSGRRQATWIKRLEAARKRPNLGGILVVVDGDATYWEGASFCPADAARTLSDRARATGAGTLYSLGFVFACLEFETWLLAGIESLAGKRFSDGRPGVRQDIGRYGEDLESSPRGAKRILGTMMERGYKPTLDQAELTKLVDLSQVRERGLKSFARLETAVQQMAKAFQSGQHVATPPSS